MAFFGNPYNLLILILTLIFGVATFLSLRKNYKRLSFYFEGASYFSNDFGDRITKLHVTKKAIQINPSKDYVTYNFYIQNTGKSDLIKTDFSDEIKIILPNDAKVIDCKTTDSPLDIHSSISILSNKDLAISFQLLKKGEIIKISAFLEIDKTKSLQHSQIHFLKDTVFYYRGINFKKVELIVALKKHTTNLYYGIALFTIFEALAILLMIFLFHGFSYRSSYDIINFGDKIYHGDLLTLNSKELCFHIIQNIPHIDSILLMKNPNLNNLSISKHFLKISDYGYSIWIVIPALMIHYLAALNVFKGRIKYKRKIEKLFQ